jgi:TPR repeat protein
MCLCDALIGCGVDQDLNCSAEYYRLSAEQGNAEGHLTFGQCLHRCHCRGRDRGRGDDENLNSVSEYSRLSAEQ